MERLMTYSIVGTGNIGKTLATYFAKAKIEVALANTRGAEAVEPIAKKLNGTVTARSLDEALRTDIIFVAVPFLNFKDVGSLRPDWTNKIVIDVTNAFMLPADVQKAELNGRLSSEVNADRETGEGV
jgi:8-hydroxy-5-deazaflavin:NADPH oxidoreductase